MIDYDELYKDTVAIVKSAVNGLAASETPTSDIKALVDETFNALLDLHKRIENVDTPVDKEDSEFDDI